MAILLVVALIVESHVLLFRGYEPDGGNSYSNYQDAYP